MKTKLNNDILRLVILTRRILICAVSTILLFVIRKVVVMNIRKRGCVRENLIFDVLRQQERSECCNEISFRDITYLFEIQIFGCRPCYSITYLGSHGKCCSSRCFN